MLTQQKAINLTFPQLETLMPENDRLVLFLGNVHDHHIISVDENGLVGDSDLFDALLLVPQYKDVGVTDIKFILPLYQKFALKGVTFVHFKDEET